MPSFCTKATFGWLFFLIATGLQAAPLQQDTNAPLQWGYSPASASCHDSPGFLAGATSIGEVCLRYFPGAVLAQAETVVVVMYGDRSEYLTTPIEQLKDNTQSAQEKLARRMAKKAGLPLLVLARPGTFGSSGFHHEKKTESELVAMEFALDALKSRYGIRRFILLGHSGGGLVSAAMITRGRNDVRCAVLVSTPFDLMDRAISKHATSPSQGLSDKLLKAYGAQYDPLQHVENVINDQDRMIYLLGNPGDKTTPFNSQKRFAEALRLAGHRVVLEVRSASDSNFHRISYSDSLAQIKMCVASSR